jgi:hypothetical protein
MEVEPEGGVAESADPFETIFAKRGEKQHKSGKKKVVSKTYKNTSPSSD